MAILVFKNETGDSGYLELNQESKITIGRSRKNVVVFQDDLRVSKFHCEIYFHPQEKRYILKDLGARNGSILNGNRVSVEIILSNEDTVSIGNSSFLFMEETYENYNLIKTKRIDKKETKFINSGGDNDTRTCMIPKLENIRKKPLAMGSSIISIAVGSIIKKYKVISSLGQFEHGKVFKVQHIETNEIYALKIFKKFFDDDDIAVSKFNKIMKHCITLKNSSLIQYYDYDIYNGLCYFTMDYISDYTTLDDKIAESAPFTELEVLNIIKIIGDALEALNTLGYIHGDLYPANIIYNKNKDLIIMDYAFSAWLNQYIEPYKNFVAPWYISPEQVLGKKTNHYSDMYSLGIILFQMLSGYIPFHSDNLKEICEMRLKYEFPSIFTYNPNIFVSKSTLNLLSTLVETDSLQRYDTWQKFNKSLHWLIEKLIKGNINRKPIYPQQEKKPKDMFNNFFK